MISVNLIGRIANELEPAKTESNKTYIRTNLACRNRKGDTEFVPIVVWEKTAETMMKYCGKGSLIAVNGEFHSFEYERNGDKRKIWDVQVERLELLGGKDDGKSAKKREKSEELHEEDVNDDDMPF